MLEEHCAGDAFAPPLCDERAKFPFSRVRVLLFSSMILICRILKIGCGKIGCDHAACRERNRDCKRESGPTASPRSDVSASAGSVKDQACCLGKVVVDFQSSNFWHNYQFGASVVSRPRAAELLSG